MQIDGYELTETCGGCPEQYDVFLSGRLVGYLRLRYGVFTAHYHNSSGRVVYSAQTIGDGIFDPAERELHLTEAIHQIKQAEAEEATTT